MASTRQLRITFLYALVMLIAQFLLGMAVNLFVKIPTDHPGSNPPEYFSGVAQSVTWAILHGNIWLAIHAGFGLVLGLAAIGHPRPSHREPAPRHPDLGGGRVHRRAGRRLQRGELSELPRGLQLDDHGDRIRGRCGCLLGGAVPRERNHPNSRHLVH